MPLGSGLSEKRIPLLSAQLLGLKWADGSLGFMGFSRSLLRSPSFLPSFLVCNFPDHLLQCIFNRYLTAFWVKFGHSFSHRFHRCLLMLHEKLLSRSTEFPLTTTSPSDVRFSLLWLLTLWSALRLQMIDAMAWKILPKLSGKVVSRTWSTLWKTISLSFIAPCGWPVPSFPLYATRARSFCPRRKNH